MGRSEIKAEKMSVNSISSNDSLLHLQHSSIISLPIDMHCLVTRPSSIIFISFSVTSILLILPISVFILYLGGQRWRQQRSSSSSSSSSASMSHCDSFTYHMVGMELIGVFGSILCCCGIYVDYYEMILAGFIFLLITWHGEMIFHILTCVERYLAVVHPITYRSLRNKRMIRIRNIINVCVWLLCCAATSLMSIERVLLVFDICIWIVSLIIISLCSVSVLFVLVRPGPGKRGGDRVDQSKLRVFYTILGILGVLLLKCSLGMISSVLYLRGRENCVLVTSDMFLGLPCSLVLPVLFLHRSGKIVCCKNKTDIE